jgi:hypothetical protein
MAEGADHLVLFEAAASPGFFPSLTGAIAIVQSLAAATFMLGGASAKRRLEQTEARLADTLPICNREGLTVMSTPTTRVMHRSLRADAAESVGGEGRLADRRKRPPRARCIRRAPRSPASAISTPRVLAAMEKQAAKLAYAHTGFFTSEPAEELAERLVGHEPGGLAYVYYVSGDRKRSKPASRSRGNTLSNAASPQAGAFHRTAPELSRQHAGRACRRRAMPGAASPMRRCCRARSAM